ncbi:MAG: FliA/WhiG family RNA polymerase sigma factor [Phycisphaerales bacterium]|nr:FliA/WhiG family RNA polymerase sigma factor [Phycisphaerales bacterium]
MQPTVSREELVTMWVEYKATASEELRNRLMEIYFPLVRYNSERIAAKLPDEVDTQDLVSAGVFGLVDAIESFDLERGVKFETYCAARIRGAILDELRAMDWVPRLVRSRAHRLDHATRSLLAQNGQMPTVDDLQRHLKLPQDDFERLVRDSKAITQVSLSRRQFETDSSREVREIDVLVDRRGTDPMEEAQKRDIRDLMTRGLTRAERLILILYYYEQMTMKEIGMTLDLSESRVSQMHSAILERLKAQLTLKPLEIEEFAA